MSINPFSLVVILLVGGLFLKNFRKPIEVHIKNLFLVTVCLSLFLNVGWFLRVGSLEIGYSFVVSFLLFLLCLVYLFCNGKFSGKLLALGFLLCLSALIGVVHSALEPYRYGVVQNSWDYFVMGLEELTDSPVRSLSFSTVFGIVRFPVILAVLYVIYRKEDGFRALNVIGMLTNGFIAYGFLEIFFRFLLRIDLTTLFLNPFFGEAYPTLAGTERLQGLFKEPSHYAQGLLYLCVLSLFSIRVERDERKRLAAHCRLFCLLALLLLSTSFSALFYAVAVVALYPCVCRGVKARYIVGIGACLVLVALLLCTNGGFMRMLGLESLYERIDRTFRTFGALFAGERGTPSSEGARFTSIYYMIEIVLHRPLFGIGIGITDAHSTVFAVLANFGLVGFCLWGAVLVMFGKIKRNGIFFVAVFALCLAIAGGVGFMMNLGYPFIFACAGAALAEPLPERRHLFRALRRRVAA